MKKPKDFTYEEYDYDTLCAYAGLDCIATSETMAALMKQMAVSPTYAFFVKGKRQMGQAKSVMWEQLNVKAKAMNFAVDLEVAGIYYHQDRNRDMAARMEKDIEDTRHRIFAAIGRELDLNSTTELGLFLYSQDHCGFETPVKTQKGEDSTSGESMESLYKQYKLEWLLDIKRYKDVSAMYNNFIKTYIEDFVKGDSRVHPKYNLHGTSSHRISSNDPNLLNLPRGYYDYDIRGCYGVPRGMVFLTFDFSSCEVKILAALSGDETMIEACISGKDFHSYTACMINHLDYDEFVHIIEDKTHPKHKEYKLARQAAKAVTFGLLYGKTVFSLSLDLGVSKDEAQEIMNNYFEIYPKVRDFINDCHQMARANQYVVTPFGQRKQEHGTLDCFRPTAAFNAALRNSQNVMIQSPASTLGLMVFAELNRRLADLGGRCICTVYDSIEIEIPIDRVAEAIELGFYIMDDWPQEEFEWLNFPIGSDGEIGFDWGTLETVHRGITQSEVEAILMDIDKDMFEWSKAA